MSFLHRVTGSPQRDLSDSAKPRRRPAPALHCEEPHEEVVQGTNENAKFALEASSGMTNGEDTPERTLKGLHPLSDLGEVKKKDHLCF